MEDGKPLSAKEKRHEQIKRWQNSATDLECATYANPKTKVKFDDGAVFLAACSAGDLDEVKALLNGGANINFANVDGLTALHQVGSSHPVVHVMNCPFRRVFDGLPSFFMIHVILHTGIIASIYCPNHR